MRRGFRDIDLPPLSLSDSGMGGLAGIAEMFSMDNIKDIAILGLVGTGATVAANLIVRNAGRVPMIGGIVGKYGPVVPLAIGLAARKWLTPRSPRLSLVVQGVAFGAAVYTALDSWGFFQKTGLAGLMGDDGIAADIYVPELVGLGAMPYDDGVPATAYLTGGDVVDEGNFDDGSSDGSEDLGEIMLPSQSEDEDFEPGYELGEGDGGFPEDAMGGNLAMSM